MQFLREPPQRASRGSLGSIDFAYWPAALRNGVDLRTHDPHRPAVHILLTMRWGGHSHASEPMLTASL